MHEGKKIKLLMASPRFLSSFHVGPYVFVIELGVFFFRVVRLSGCRCHHPRPIRNWVSRAVLPHFLEYAACVLSLGKLACTWCE